jgi:formylmethanofuran dehydrogenase subunit E
MTGKQAFSFYERKSGRSVRLVLRPKPEGMTREEMDAILSVIESADYTPARDREERVIDIIVEEMSPCLTGAKPYREAAAIVQNRVRILVQEEGGN